MNNYGISVSELLRLAIEQGKIPRYLYKYTTAENAIKAIEGGSVYFARFVEFNDEYEGFAKLDTNNNSAEWGRFFIQNGIFGWQAHFLMNTVMSNPQKASEIIKTVIEEIQNNNGFLCLSTKPNNVLMWAHYADQNKGCCLEYDLLADTEVFGCIKKIQYDDNTIMYNYLQNQGDALESMFHKSKQWEYEDEYRVIWINQHGVRKVKDGSLSKIILGSKISKIKEDEIRTKIQIMNTKPTICRATRGNNPKELDIVTV